MVLHQLLVLGSLGIGIFMMVTHSRYKKLLVDGAIGTSHLEEYKHSFTLTSALFIGVLTTMMVIDWEFIDGATILFLLFSIGVSVYQMITVRKSDKVSRSTTYSMFWDGILMFLVAFLYLIY